MNPLAVNSWWTDLSLLFCKHCLILRVKFFIFMVCEDSILYSFFFFKAALDLPLYINLRHTTTSQLQ